MSKHPTDISKEAIARFQVEFERVMSHHGVFLVDITKPNYRFILAEKIWNYRKLFPYNFPRHVRYAYQIDKKIMDILNVWTFEKRPNGDMIIFNVPRWFGAVIELKASKKNINQIRPWQCLPMVLIRLDCSIDRYRFISMKTIFEVFEGSKRGHHTTNKEVIAVGISSLEQLPITHLASLPIWIERDCRDNFDWCRVRSHPYIVAAIKSNFPLAPLGAEDLYMKVREYGMDRNDVDIALGC